MTRFFDNPQPGFPPTQPSAASLPTSVKSALPPSERRHISLATPGAIASPSARFSSSFRAAAEAAKPEANNSCSALDAQRELGASGAMSPRALATPPAPSSPSIHAEQNIFIFISIFISLGISSLRCRHGSPRPTRDERLAPSLKTRGSRRRGSWRTPIRQAGPPRRHRPRRARSRGSSRWPRREDPSAPGGRQCAPPDRSWPGRRRRGRGAGAPRRPPTARSRSAAR